jgi:hypothetical protein
MQGTITATAGNIGGFTINSSSLASSNGNMFISGSPLIGGIDNPRYMFISSSNFNVKQNGDISGSQVLFTGGKVGGFQITSQVISGSNIVIDSAGTIRTANYIPDFQGWAITANNNGFAEFENAKIRGTLSTAVFEKETVNAVGGQLYVANSTTLTSSAAFPNGTYPPTATTMSVENASGFVPNEILSLKKVSPTGFSTEYIRVMSASRNNPSSDTDLSGQLFVERAYGFGLSGNSASLGNSPGTAQAYSGSQVLVSTGVSGSGYIRINANPSDPATPYIDVVERTGSGVYDVDLKARLGDLSGLAGTPMVLGRTDPGFGLATDNVYLQGGINAQFGNIGGFNIQSNAITGSGFYLSGASTGSQFFISSSNFNVKANGDVTASNALFTGIAKADVLRDKTVTITSALTSSYMRVVDIEPLAGTTLAVDLVLDGTLGGEIVRRVRIAAITGSGTLPIGKITVPADGDAKTDVYIESGIDIPFYSVFSSAKGLGIVYPPPIRTLSNDSIAIFTVNGATGTAFYQTGGSETVFPYQYQHSLVIGTGSVYSPSVGNIGKLLVSSNANRDGSSNIYGARFTIDNYNVSQLVISHTDSSTVATQLGAMRPYWGFYVNSQTATQPVIAVSASDNGTDRRVAINSGVHMPYVETSVTYTIATSDYTICTTGTAAAPGITLTLPTGSRVNQGRMLNILHRKTAGITLIDCLNADTIDGDAALSTSTPSASIQLQCNGQGIWRILAISSGSWT